MDKRLVWKRRNVWLSALFAIEAIFLTFAFCVVWFSQGQPIQAATVNSPNVLTGSVWCLSPPLGSRRSHQQRASGRPCLRSINYAAIIADSDLEYTGSCRIRYGFV